MTEESTGTTGNRLQIDVWSDVMCPFCYMGDTLLARALAKFPHADAVDIRYHSFLLMPELAADEVADLSSLLQERRGISREQAESMNAQVTERGAALGLDYRFDIAQTTNMRRAHELSHFALAEGKQHDVMQRLFRAYFTEGRNLGDAGELADLAEEAGLDRDAALAAIRDGRYADAVEHDIQEARQLGITGVPFFVFNRKYAVSGAQPEEAFVQTLQMVWDETQGAPVGASAVDGA